MPRVCVSALGATTPVGLAAEAAAAAVRAGISRIGKHPTMVDGAGNPLRCAMVPRGPQVVPAAERLTWLASHALSQVEAKALAVLGRDAAVALFVALPELRPGFGADDARSVMRALPRALASRGEPIRAEAVGSGHAGALVALHAACGQLRAGRLNAAVVLGVDSWLDADAIDWLEEGQRLSREEVRGGFIPGEAAGAVVLATEDHLGRIGAPALAEVIGSAQAVERRSPESPEGLLGEGLGEAVRAAAAAAGLRSSDGGIDEVYCDINGERHRVDEWAFVALREYAAFRDASAYVTPVTTWGDVGAASGALGCVLAVQAWQRRYARGPRALAYGSSPRGLRGAVLLQQVR